MLTTIRNGVKEKTKSGGWVDGWMDGWMDGRVDVKAVSRIAYNNQIVN